MLLAAAVISLLLHEISDAVIIAVVVLMNAVVGMIQEGESPEGPGFPEEADKPSCLCDPGGVRKEDSGFAACGWGYCMSGCRLPGSHGPASYQNKQPEGGRVGADWGIGSY